jgi:hypothetical protein
MEVKMLYVFNEASDVSTRSFLTKAFAPHIVQEIRNLGQITNATLVGGSRFFLGQKTLLKYIKKYIILEVEIKDLNCIIKQI